MKVGLDVMTDDCPLSLFSVLSVFSVVKTFIQFDHAKQTGMNREQAISSLTELLTGRKNMLIFTGAGISTASGIPDYRGPQGVWKTKTPVYYQDFLSSKSSRIRYWTTKTEDWAAYRNVDPNPVHQAIADLTAAGKVIAVVTQNVDGLHRKSGLPEEKLIEIHGTNAKIECQSCGSMSDPDPIYGQFGRTGIPPKCECGGYLKPATISFGQSLRQNDLQRAFDLSMQSDLIISLGSTLSVEPAASIPRSGADRGTPYIVINQRETGHDGLSCLTLRISDDVMEIFPEAVNSVLS